MSIHDGHRKRVKDRFLKEGLENFSEVNVLELLLFYSISRKDTNPIAHALLNHFGSLTQVLEAPFDELVKVEGVTENSAVLMRLIVEMGRYYMVSRGAATTSLHSIEACGRYMQPYFLGRRNECIFLLCLDAKCKVLGCKEVAEGSINAASVSIRRIVEVALSSNATSVVLAHNHPGGVAAPSDEDVYTTYRIADALKVVDVQLEDHIVMAEDDFISMLHSGRYHREGDCMLI